MYVMCVLCVYHVWDICLVFVSCVMCIGCVWHVCHDVSCCEVCVECMGLAPFPVWRIARNVQTRQSMGVS